MARVRCEQGAIDSSFKVINVTCHLRSAEQTPLQGSGTKLSQPLHHHPLQQHYVGHMFDRLLGLKTNDSSSWLWSGPHESCLHVEMQMRQSHPITKVNWYPPYIVVMANSEQPVWKLRQRLNVRLEVASPNRSHKNPSRVNCRCKKRNHNLNIGRVSCWTVVFHAPGLSVGLSWLQMFLACLFQC